MDGISFSDPQKVHITGTIKNSDLSGEQIIDVQTLTPLNDTIEKDKTTSQETIKPQEHVPLPPTGGLLDNNHILGSQKYITILCRFGDFADFTPKPPSEIQDLLDRVDNYWQEVSYNRANLEGSDVTGWYNLPDTRAGYAGSFPAGGIDLDKFTTDCIDQADPDIFFPDFDGIILLVNTNLFGAFGGFGSPAFPFNRDGEIKNYKLLYLSSDGWHNQDIFTHEVAHTFSLPHSSGPYGMVYDSNWDVLSSTEDCKDPEPEFRCEGPHTIAFHKYVKGWIDDSRTYIANSSPDQVIFLERLAEPGPNGNLLALIPIGNSNTDFYSIESRKSVNLDKEIPDNGVLINKINLALPETPVQVVDTTFNANPNDKGAIWTPGEIFKDNINNISIKILKETPTGFWVVINPTLWTTIWEEIFD
jgi:hypothetical protein